MNHNRDTPTSQKNTNPRVPAPKVRNGRDLSVYRKGLSGSLLGDFYYRVMLATWAQFFAAAILVYLSINAGFATVYYLHGDMILNARPGSFLDAYIFSFQTSTTIGYGYLLPKNGYAHAIVMVDVFSGLIFVAVLTGLVFSRLAKPRASVMFSDSVLLTQHGDQDALLIRLANGRKHSSIVNTRVSAVVLMEDKIPNSRIERRFFDLHLERDHIPVFALTWTLIHIIDEQSPLFGFDEKAIREAGAILIVTLDGIEDILAQTVHTHHIYDTVDFKFNKNFVDILGTHTDGSRMIDYGKFHHLEDIENE